MCNEFKRGEIGVLPVTFELFVDNNLPGLVECVLVDSDNCSHRFVKKRLW